MFPKYKLVVWFFLKVWETLRVLSVKFVKFCKCWGYARVSNFIKSLILCENNNHLLKCNNQNLLLLLLTYLPSWWLIWGVMSYLISRLHPFERDRITGSILSVYNKSTSHCHYKKGDQPWDIQINCSTISNKVVELSQSDKTVPVQKLTPM